MTRYGTSKSDECYNRWWQIAATALISIGMLTAASRSLLNLVDSFAAFAIMGAMAAVLVSQVHLPVGPRIGGREILLWALVAGASAGALSGLATLMGTSAILVAAVFLIASPWVLGANWHWLDLESDAVLWGYSGYAPLRFQLATGVETPSADQLDNLKRPNSAAPTQGLTPRSTSFHRPSAINWDELLGEGDRR